MFHSQQSPEHATLKCHKIYCNLSHTHTSQVCNCFSVKKESNSKGYQPQEESKEEDWFPAVQQTLQAENHYHICEWLERWNVSPLKGVVREATPRTFVGSKKCSDRGPEVSFSGIRARD